MIEVNEYVRTDKGYIFKVDEEKKNLQIANFLDVEYGKMIKHSKQLIDLIECGDFENVRLLTDTEFEKYSRMFAKYFNEIGRDELRLVHYSYYNGCDEPSIYELEEI